MSNSASPVGLPLDGSASECEASPPDNNDLMEALDSSSTTDGSRHFRNATNTTTQQSSSSSSSRTPPVATSFANEPHPDEDAGSSHSSSSSITATAADSDAAPSPNNSNSNNNNTTSTTNCTKKQQVSLEERVDELETKLAVLVRLLQQQRRWAPVDATNRTRQPTAAAAAVPLDSPDVMVYRKTFSDEMLPSSQQQPQPDDAYEPSLEEEERMPTAPNSVPPPPQQQLPVRDYSMDETVVHNNHGTNHHHHNNNHGNWSPTGSQYASPVSSSLSHTSPFVVLPPPQQPSSSSNNELSPLAAHEQDAPTASSLSTLVPPQLTFGALHHHHHVDVVAPLPQKTHNKRNLSFRLLYASDEDENDNDNSTATTANRILLSDDQQNEQQQQRRHTASSPSTGSLTLSERLWLGRDILQYQRDENAAECAKERQSAAAVAAAAAAAAMGSSHHTSSSHHPTSRNNNNNKPSYSRFPIQRQPPDDKVRNKWLDYLNSFQESTPDVDVQMEEFIKVPAGVETVMSFGFFICVDSFLYMITVLPIRFVWSCFLLLRQVVVEYTTSRKQQSQPQQPQQWGNTDTDHYHFHRQHLYQLIQVTILYTVYRYVLAAYSIGKLYHWIRGQAMLKLYVLTAIVEVFDRLFSSLGQDCLESMYWNTVSRPRSRRMIISILVVMIYASIHSLLLFVHVVTLHVAMNSTDQILLSLLISGNFAEIKSTVFKKYNKAALFKITASDVCERFKLVLFLSLVLLLNLCQGMDQRQFLSYIRVCGIVCGAEVLADWVKHSFITKFNFLPARVYPEYSLLLAGDVTGIGHEGVNLDHSHAVVKRIGFSQIPLVCVLFRLIREAAKYAVLTLPSYLLTPALSTVIMVGLWVLLLMVKLALGSLLQRISLGKLLAAPEYSQQQSPPLAKKKTK